MSANYYPVLMSMAVVASAFALVFTHSPTPQKSTGPTVLTQSGESIVVQKRKPLLEGQAVRIELRSVCGAEGETPGGQAARTDCAGGQN